MPSKRPFRYTTINWIVASIFLPLLVAYWLTGPWVFDVANLRLQRPADLRRRPTLIVPGRTKPARPLPQDHVGPDTVWFKMFTDKSVTLEAAAAALRSAGDWQVKVVTQELRPGETESQIVVRERGHDVGVGIADGPHVLLESAELAERHGANRPNRQELAHCARRFEIAYELREDMDNFNTVCFIEHALQRLLGNHGITFDSGSGIFP